MRKSLGFWERSINREGIWIVREPLADYCFVEKIEKNPFRDTAFATIPVLLYGTVYLSNIAINGVGVWPDTNDWYGFTTWGTPMTFVIFGVITLISWIMAVIMRWVHIVIQKRRENK